MFRKIIKSEVEELQKNILRAVKAVNDLKFNDTHKVCGLCGITGHKIDMKEVWDYTEHSFYHNGCYAEKFQKHLCPCKCGKWIDNEKKVCK